MADFVFVYITCESYKQATSIGAMLVEEKIAACVNILPEMTSIYSWDGRLEEKREAVLIAKTRKSLFKTLAAQVKKMHGYEKPCIVSFDIADGNMDFLQWIKAETKL